MKSNVGKVLVDTCVFINYFRPNKSPYKKVLRELILDRQVILSPFVKLELLQGIRKNERKMLSSLLGELDTIPISNDLFDAAELLFPLNKKQGLNVGLIDYLLIVQALSANAAFFTIDQTLKRLAKRLGADVFSLKSNK